MNTTLYFEDFCQYYEKAKKLQEANLRGEKISVGDDLMENIPIYDTVNRCYAGFSNIPQQLWYGSKNPKVKQRIAEYDRLQKDWDFETWLYVFLVHRITGSGASFSHDHGFRNTIIYKLAELNTVPEMVQWIKNYEGVMFTSIGNQIPAFPKPNDEYKTGGKLYLCKYAPKLAQVLARDPLRTSDHISIQELVDGLLQWQTLNKLKRYKFVLTAFAMDIAEYWPHIVDPYSNCYYGKNCLEAMNLCFSDGKKNNYDDKMEWTCRYFGGIKPMDCEDLFCDYIRYVENYIPKGYSYFKNNSLIKDHPHVSR